MPDDNPVTTPAAPAPAPAPAPTTTPAPGATPPVDPATPPAPDEVLGEPGKRALEAERAAHKAAAARATAAEAELQKIADANLSELEKAKKDTLTAKDEATKATTEALRWRLAARHGISDEDAELFLVGTDEATLTSQAERVAARLAAPGQPLPRTPAPDPGQGARPDAAASAEAEYAQYAADMKLPSSTRK